MENGIQRWTAKRKSELVLQLIKGEKTLVEICRSQDLKQSEVQGWLDAYMKSGEQGLKTNAKGEQSLHEREVKDLRAKVGELILELDARKKLQALIELEENAS